MRALTLVLMLLALALAGCGSDDDEEGAAGGETAVSTAPDEPAEGEPEAGATTTEDGAAPIVLKEPREGATVENPLHVSGTAMVFEATLVVRIRDANGDEVGTATITATEGAPERGTFEGDVPYEVDEAQDGTVEVFSPSAEDNSEQHKVSVRVRLSP